MMSDNSVLYFYEQEVKLAEQEVARVSKQINILSFLRLFLMGAILLTVYMAVKAESVLLTEIAFLAGVIAFAFLVSKQAKFEKKKAFFEDLRRVNENELESIRNHQNMYADGTEYIDDNHVYTSDLDVFGKASLYHFLNRCATTHGKLKLALWLKQKAETPEILARQEAIQELSTKVGWIQHLKAMLLFADKDPEGEVSRLFQYLKLPLASFHSLIKKYVRFSPWALGLCALAGYFSSICIVLAVALGVFNIILVFIHSVDVNKADRWIGRAGRIFSNYSDAFKWLEEESFISPYIKSPGRSGAGENAFYVKLKELSRLAGKLETRLNIFVGPVLNFLFAWDLRQVIAIEHWKESNVEGVERAFDDLARLEALVSIATLHLNHPFWCFPNISDGEGYTYSAVDIGHPLIEEDKRVVNDFDLEDAFKIDIITGSNMAGKSTFLRTIGINAILALAGAPVCAREMSVSNMLIFTYMRIKDSLNESTSTFKAELNRLKLLLETLNQHPKVYFLIDEMLRGTNSVDKYLGSKAIIEQLIAKNAVGVVATHDLQIARLEDDHPAYIRNFYFDIQIIDTEMLFDYKIKHGECKTFNASILLKQLGIRFETKEI